MNSAFSPIYPLLCLSACFSSFLPQLCIPPLHWAHKQISPAVTHSLVCLHLHFLLSFPPPFFSPFFFLFQSSSFAICFVNVSGRSVYSYIGKRWPRSVWPAHIWEVRKERPCWVWTAWMDHVLMLPHKSTQPHWICVHNHLSAERGFLFHPIGSSSSYFVCNFTIISYCSGIS